MGGLGCLGGFGGVLVGLGVGAWVFHMDAELSTGLWITIGLTVPYTHTHPPNQQPDTHTHQVHSHT